MKVSYYPGCTLRTKAKELDRYARACGALLGVELCEVPDWQCCGGVFSTAKDEIASKLPAVRALVAAREAGQPLVTVCAACHHVMKQTNHAMQTDPDFAARVNAYMAQDKDSAAPYHGETAVYHYLELLWDTVVFDRVREAVKNPLTGQKIAAYYGCMLLRPGKVMGFDDPENPRILEDFIRALGAEPVIYAQRNECCGGYTVLENPAGAEKRSRAVSDDAAAHGAQRMVTACPLCRYNLEKNGSSLPVVYFTELLAEAMGLKEGTHGNEE